ncbi:MAG: hypothetical protein PHT95_06825 [Candidatus Omnitrophica bacterium]|nr:hypothetical protein [Candidatus Omnitrophota bacterium]
MQRIIETTEMATRRNRTVWKILRRFNSGSKRATAEKIKEMAVPSIL